MTLSEQAGDGHPVVFRPLVERLESTELTDRLGVVPGKAQSRVSLFVMTNHGDHVEWTDGREVWRWRLPDQTGDPARYPTLATILLASDKSAVTGRVAAYRIRFLDERGITIGRLDPYRRMLMVGVPKIIVDLAFPDEAFEELRNHGVGVTHETIRNNKEYYDVHPDPALSRRALSFARHPRTWVAAVVVPTMVALALILTLLNR